MALETRIDQRLEDDAKLVFKFPNPENGRAPFTRTCPFFENPIIKEDQNSNLIKYDVIGRTGNIFGYTGAKSRSFSVTFFITLPLILELSRGLADSGRAPSDLSKEEQKDAFFVLQADNTDFQKERTQNSYNKNASKYINRVAPAGSPERTFLEENYNPFTNGEDPLGVPLDSTTAAGHDLILYWVNLIRSSTLTYAPNPSVGPPIIRFTHGSLYRNIATVASRYNITVDDKFGYDRVTLLPRRIEVSLTLHEVQSNGDMSFEFGKALNPDRISGWERVVGRKDPRTSV
tara:strand:- start:5239 stop:6105 length:867 start_codon:yes stop_codon:yes gene_type:complete